MHRLHLKYRAAFGPKVQCGVTGASVRRCTQRRHIKVQEGIEMCTLGVSKSSLISAPFTPHLHLKLMGIEIHTWASCGVSVNSAISEGEGAKGFKKTRRGVN